MLTVERVSRVERQCRLCRLALAVMAIGLVAVLLVGSGANDVHGKLEVLDEVRAKRFVAVDEGGREFMIVGDSFTMPGMIPPSPKNAKAITLLGNDGKSAICICPDWYGGAAVFLSGTFGIVNVMAGADAVGLRIIRGPEEGIWVQATERRVGINVVDKDGKTLFATP